MRAKLLSIQTELKAPKNQRNSFGNYNYRSCEDILEAVKPLLHKYECCLKISDEIVEVGGRVYVKSTASIFADNTGVVLSSTAFAREAEIQKGMSEPQITGSASSYARKYALNGLFLIDDTKDDDVTNTHGKTEQKAEKPKGNLIKAISSIQSCPDKATLTKLKGFIDKNSWTEKELDELGKSIEQKEGIL